MDSSLHHDPEQQLDALFAQYRESCQAPEPSPQFMPRLWKKIEAHQTPIFFFGRIARTLVTAAAATCLVMGVYFTIPRSGPALQLNASYIDALASENSETVNYFGPANFDPSNEPGDGDLL